MRRCTRRTTKKKSKTVIFKRSTPLPRFEWVYGTVFLGLCFSTIVCRPDLAASSLLSARNHHDKPYAVIFGTVWGPDDHPVYGVKVKIRRENEKKARWELYSDHNGEFAQHVPPGKQDYVIWADARGYKSASGKRLQAEAVKVHIDADERVDTGLHLK
jgi:hypothetical protein